MKFRRRIIPIAVALVAAAIAIAAASAAGNRNHSKHAGTLKIALANSFIGNTWRLEMENTFKAACKMLFAGISFTLLLVLAVTCCFVAFR